MSDQSETAKTPADRTLEADNLILHSLDELHRVHFRFKKLPHNTGVKVLEVMRVSMLRGVRLPQASEDPNAYFTALVLGLTPAAYLEIRETLYSFAAYRKDEDTAWVDLGRQRERGFRALDPLRRLPPGNPGHGLQFFSIVTRPRRVSGAGDGDVPVHVPGRLSQAAQALVQAKMVTVEGLRTTITMEDFYDYVDILNRRAEEQRVQRSKAKHDAMVARYQRNMRAGRKGRGLYS